jgi:Flp pilus assembly protein TadG
VKHSRGAVSVEFALVSIVFIGLTVAVMEFGRVMFLYNNLVEATRMGARVATVCSTSAESVVKAKMISMASNIGLAASDISIVYPTNSCSAADCDGVTVSIGAFVVPLSIPFVNLRFPLPPATTSVPSESLSSTDNVACQ